MLDGPGPAIYAGRMDKPLVVFLVVVALITALPGWLTGSILKKASRAEGGGGTEWVPLGYLPYGLREFKHPRKGAILFGYVFSNLLSWGAILTLVAIFIKSKSAG